MLGSYDERTALGEARLKATLKKRAEALTTLITARASLPERNKNRLTETDATELSTLVAYIINLIETI